MLHELYSFILIRINLLAANNSEYSNSVLEWSKTGWGLINNRFSYFLKSMFDTNGSISD